MSLSTENLGIKNSKLFEGDMVLSSFQRLAAMRGLDVDKAAGNTRGSILNKKWPSGVMIYAVDPSIGKKCRIMMKGRRRKRGSRVRVYPRACKVLHFRMVIAPNSVFIIK